MHYINGREAKEGDFVIHRDPYGSKQISAGRIHQLQASSSTCTGQLAKVIPGGVSHICVTMKDCVHVEDAWAQAAFDVPTGNAEAVPT